MIASSATVSLLFINTPTVASNIMMQRTLDGIFVDTYSAVPENLRESFCTDYDKYIGWTNKCIMVTVMRVPARFKLESPADAPVMRVGYAFSKKSASSFQESPSMEYTLIGSDNVADNNVVQFEASLPEDVIEGVEYRLVILTENKLGIIAYFSSPITLLYYETPPNGAAVTTSASNRIDTRDYAVYVRPGPVFFVWDDFPDRAGILKYEFRSVLGEDHLQVENQEFQKTFGLTRVGLLRYGTLLMDGTSLHMQVRATNMAGLQSTLGRHVIADAYGPVCQGMPLDLSARSSDIWSDVEYTRQMISFRTRWSCADSTSGISRVMLGVGTQQFATDVIALRDMPINTTVLEFSDISLKLRDSIRYYLTLVVEDAVGWKTIGSSNGVVLDTRPPMCAGMFAPRDGSDPSLDIEHQRGVSTLSATWNEAFDEVSQDLRARVQAQSLSQANGNTIVEPLSPWIDVGFANSAKVTMLRLAHGSRYRVAIQLRDQAGNEALCVTSGVTLGEFCSILIVRECIYACV
jgi:hypothetical protein